MSDLYTSKVEVPQVGMNSDEVLLKWFGKAIGMDPNNTQDWKKPSISYIGHSKDYSVSFPVRVEDDSVFSSSQESTYLNTPGGSFSHSETLTNVLVNASSQSDNIVSSSSASSSSSMLTLVLAVSLLLALLWYPFRSWWLQKILRSAEDPSSELSHLPLPPGEFGLPIIGETFSWLSQGALFNSSRRKKYGNVFKTNVIGSSMVRVSGHEYVGEVLKGEHDKVTTIWPINVRQILGENVLVNSMGAVHRLKRRITCKAFTSAALDGYIPTLCANAKRNIQALSECERPLMYDRMLRLTFDLAASTLLGLDTAKSSCNKIVDVFYQLVSNIFCIPLKIPGLGFCKAMNARAQILDLLQDHIGQKKKNLMANFEDDNTSQDNKAKVAFDIIIEEMLRENFKKGKENGECLLNNNNNVTKEQSEEDCEPISDFALKEIAMELMFAGYFTSGSALTSCILELARNPRVFKKVEEELLQVGLLKKEDAPDSKDVELNLQLVHRLTYLEQVLKETLRIRPPVLGGYRKAKKTFQLGDYRVPKGWTVIYNIRDTHDFEYEGMDSFEPERFAPGQNKDEKFKFVAFGGGPRMCIGREFARLSIKITIIELFRTFKGWELAEKKLPKMIAIPTLHPKGGLPCKVYPREKYGVVSR